MKRLLPFFLIIFTPRVVALPKLTTLMITKLVKNNPGQLSVAEYSAIAQHLAQKGRCNMLVFGVGKDSSLWLYLNKGGRTLFLENSPQWLAKVKQKLPHIKAHLVTYNTQRSQWKDLLDNASVQTLLLNQPAEIFAYNWDVIFVDAPPGGSDDAPGRMKSIFTAAHLAFNSSKRVDIFVHDCNRTVEQVYCDAFLKPENLVEQTEKLRHYAINPVMRNTDHLPPLLIDFDSSMQSANKQLSKKKSELLQELKQLYQSYDPFGIDTDVYKIPRIIHQIWLGPHQPPAIFEQSQESLKRMHPGWQYKLWTDKDIKKLSLHNRTLYSLARNYGQRADIVRYEILYQFGGVYADIDFVCLKPFDAFHKNYELYTGVLPLSCANIICNGLIGAIPGHPILKHCIDTIGQDWHKANIEQRAGPAHFQKSFFWGLREGITDIIALPKTYFFPLDHGQAGLNPQQVQEFIHPETCAVHYWAGSWNKANAYIRK